MSKANPTCARMVYTDGTRPTLLLLSHVESQREPRVALIPAASVGVKQMVACASGEPRPPRARPWWSWWWWWWQSEDNHARGTQLSRLLVPLLHIAGLCGVGLLLAGRPDIARVLLRTGRPFAEVVCVAGLTIQMHETAVHDLYRQLGPRGWWLSAASHFLAVFWYVGTEVTRVAVASALGVFAAAFAAYLWCVPWPYGLSPAACVALVALSLVVRLL